MNELFAPDIRLERVPAVLWRRQLDGVLVLAPGAEEPIQISVPGDALWLLLAEPSTIHELAEDLADLYGTDESVIRADIQPALAALLNAGAIREVRSLRDSTTG